MFHTADNVPQQTGLLALEQALQQAVIHQQAGRMPDAERLYRAILHAYPRHPDANFNLGVLAAQLNLHAAGLPYFKAALDVDPKQERYWLEYSDALMQAGASDDAYQVLEQGRRQGLRGEAVDALLARWSNTPVQHEINTLVTLFTAQNFTEALLNAQAMTQRFPQHGFGWKVLGAVLQRMGRDSDALAPMQKAAALSPNDPGTHYNLGVTLMELGRPDEAEASFRHALQLQPDYADAHYNLGVTLEELGRLDEAETAYRLAIQFKPDFAVAHCNLGGILHELGRRDEAGASYRLAIQINPDYAEAHNNLGNILQELERLDEAEASCRRAIRIKPEYPEAYINLGVILKQQGRAAEAAASFLRALQLNPDYAEAHSNLGVVLKEQGRAAEAEASFLRALQIKPDYAEAHSNFGNLLQELGRLDEAEARYRRALQLKPEYAEAHCSLGYTLLLTGRLGEGWRKYEYRWEGGSPKPTRPATSLPQWRGQTPQAGDSILIFGEQGLGDKLQFSRYLPLLAERFSGRVSVVVSSPLLTLFRRSFQAVEVLDSPPVDQSVWQWHCPLLSLPLAFNTALDTIPNRVPYLVAEPTRVAYWKSRIAALPPCTRKIGVVWKTGSLMKDAALRSLSLQQLAPLLHLPGSTFFNLQKEPDQNKLPWVAAGKLLDWADEFGDFDETAALIMNLDLVIAVDTSVAHLAGALGKPTWLLNRYASEWRWMRERKDSLWYPTMRIFTQRAAGYWGEVVERVCAALRASE